MRRTLLKSLVSQLPLVMSPRFSIKERSSCTRDSMISRTGFWDSTHPSSLTTQSFAPTNTRSVASAWFDAEANEFTLSTVIRTISASRLLSIISVEAPCFCHRSSIVSEILSAPRDRTDTVRTDRTVRTAHGSSELTAGNPSPSYRPRRRTRRRADPMNSLKGTKHVPNEKHDKQSFNQV